MWDLGELCALMAKQVEAMWYIIGSGGGGKKKKKNRKRKRKKKCLNFVFKSKLKLKLKGKINQRKHYWMWILSITSGAPLDIGQHHECQQKPALSILRG